MWLHHTAVCRNKCARSTALDEEERKSAVYVAQKSEGETKGTTSRQSGKAFCVASTNNNFGTKTRSKFHPTYTPSPAFPSFHSLFSLSFLWNGLLSVFNLYVFAGITPWWNATLIKTIFLFSILLFLSFKQGYSIILWQKELQVVYILYIDVKCYKRFGFVWPEKNNF